MKSEVMEAPTPSWGLTLQGRHHGFSQSQHQAQRGAEEEEARDLEVQAGSANGAIRNLRGGSGWAGGCACPPGLPKRGGGSCRGHLQAVEEGCSGLLLIQCNISPRWGSQGRSITCSESPRAQDWPGHWGCAGWAGLRILGWPRPDPLSHLPGGPALGRPPGRASHCSRRNRGQKHP